MGDSKSPDSCMSLIYTHTRRKRESVHRSIGKSRLVKEAMKGDTRLLVELSGFQKSYVYGYQSAAVALTGLTEFSILFQV